MSSIRRQTIFGFIWRFIQNIGTQAIGFVVSIILARILMPSDYGLIAMITVFTSIASVFVTIGFSSAIIQKKDLTNIDKSTIFYFGIITAVVLYFVLFFSAPAIASFYKEGQLILLLRVQSLSLIISAFFSTHNAILTREMLFKKSFIASLCGSCVHAIVGISLAYSGFGVWALVYSNLISTTITAVATWVMVKWKPLFCFSVKSFKATFAFSVKILGLSLVNTLFNNIQALIIGKQYSSSDLAFYNRGSQFPHLIMQQVDGTTNTVLFSSLAKFQDDWESGLRVLRHAMRTSMYICFPIMIGLCAAAEPMIRFLLTDKWIECVPYVRIVAIICLFWPLSAQKNALNALGKSGIPLVMNICSHILTLTLIFFTYKISVIAMVSSTLISSTVFLVIGALVYRKKLNYKIKDQIADIFPALLLSLIVGLIMYLEIWFGFSSFLTLIIQFFTGIILYLILSHIFKLNAYTYLMSLVRPYILNALRQKQ